MKSTALTCARYGGVSMQSSPSSKLFVYLSMRERSVYVLYESQSLGSDENGDGDESVDCVVSGVGFVAMKRQ